jgi:hypothetical protein
VRGRRPADLKSEAKRWAARLGYHWMDNADPAVPFDGLMYNANVVVAVLLKKIRYGLDGDCIIENKFPADVANLRTLPLPPFVLRELWVRTQNERAWRRFYILPDTSAEIAINTAEHYRNTHYREEYGKNAPYRLEIRFEKPGNTEG